MITNKTMPTEGKFIALWPTEGSFIGTATMKWQDGVLMGFNDMTEYWEDATEENGWFGLDEAYFITNEDFPCKGAPKLF